MREKSVKALENDYNNKKCNSDTGDSISKHFARAKACCSLEMEMMGKFSFLVNETIP